MPSVTFAAVKAAVKATLDPVPRVGKVETRVGGIPTWMERKGPFRAFWEVGIASVTETHYAASDCVWEDFLVTVEGVMFLSYGENSEKEWDALLYAMREALRENPNLKVEGVATVTGGWAGFGLPQLVANDIATFADGKQDGRHHHALIQIRYRNDFDHEVE